MASGKKLRTVWMVAITGSVFAACGGAEEDAGTVAMTDTTAAAVTPSVPLTTDTATPAITPAPGTVPIAPAPAPGGTATPTPTPAPKGAAPAPAASGGNAQAGQAVFTGAGLCLACHGPTGTGTALAPNLTDNVWINIPASPTVDQIAAVVRTGVPTPKQHPTPMPPMGGASLTDTQVRDVAAYVKSLSGS